MSWGQSYESDHGPSTPVECQHCVTAVCTDSLQCETRDHDMRYQSGLQEIHGTLCDQLVAAFVRPGVLGMEMP